MKKVFTILLAFAAISSASAQWQTKDQGKNNRDNDHVYTRTGNGRYEKTGNDRYEKSLDGRYERNDDRRDYGKDYGRDRRYDGNYSTRQRDAEIDRVNRECDARIDRIQSSSYGKKSDRNRQIRDQEKERKEEIKRIYKRYDDNRNQNNGKIFGRN